MSIWYVRASTRKSSVLTSPAAFGRANERIARIQEAYVTSATTTWLDSLERSLSQMKEYQAARKKLESRRLAYDSSQSRMQKAKKEDFRLEEELRSQKSKYEDSLDDVYRRMLDIRESDADSISDLSTFIDAELAYHDRARQALLALRADWPSSSSSTFDPLPMPIRSRVASLNPSPVRESAGFDLTPSRPGPGSRRSSAMDVRPQSPASMPRLSRVPTDASVMSARASLRPPRVRDDPGDVFGDAHSVGTGESPVSSRSGSVDGRRMAPPPPPPPSRAKKPPPPPPPLKRNVFSADEVPVR